MNDISSFSVKNPKQINSYLSLLLKNKCLLNINFGEDNQAYITTLLEVNEKDNMIILDYGSKEDLNRNLLSARNVSFDADYKGIKVSFIGNALKKISYKGYSSFCMPIPKSFYWMERREYFRIKIPVGKASYCQLTLEGADKPVNINLYDISLSGFSMFNIPKQVSDLLIPSTVFLSAKLMLSDANECVVSFEIKNKYFVTGKNTQDIEKTGCQFIELTRSAENAIQHYMVNMQLHDLNK